MSSDSPPEQDSVQDGHNSIEGASVDKTINKGFKSAVKHIAKYVLMATVIGTVSWILGQVFNGHRSTHQNEDVGANAVIATEPRQLNQAGNDSKNIIGNNNIINNNNIGSITNNPTSPPPFSADVDSKKSDTRANQHSTSSTESKPGTTSSTGRKDQFFGNDFLDSPSSVLKGKK